MSQWAEWTDGDGQRWRVRLVPSSMVDLLEDPCAVGTKVELEDYDVSRPHGPWSLPVLGQREVALAKEVLRLRALVGGQEGEESQPDDWLSENRLADHSRRLADLEDRVQTALAGVDRLETWAKGLGLE